MAEAIKILTDEAENAIKAMMTSNEDTRTQFKKIVRGEVIKAKFTVQAHAQKAVGKGYKHSAGDAREAYRAVVANIWVQRGIGGSIALQHSSYNTQTQPWQPKRKGTRGDRGQSERTKQLNEYFGESRGFILRFLNNGTADRVTGGRNQRKKGVLQVRRRPNSGAIAYRGRIKGMHWFDDVAIQSATKAVENIGSRVLNMIEKRFEQS